MSGNDDDDAALVRRALQGARAGAEAADALVERHWRDMWRIAWGITGDPIGAEDVVQDAMTTAFVRLDRFDPNRGSFGAWLARITVNRSLNRRRRRRSHVPLEGVEGMVSREGAGDDNAAFLAMVATLPLPHRAVIVLRYGLDYTPQEIADTLDLRVGTVHSRLARALSSLRQTMDAHHV